ncbi:PLU-1-like protein-domain-containing protein [Umbelopsis sp. PMI_123]|nr:PLU-1-like protein-domain-containing protein [Umbelopsis sp. PMI_123]
MMKSMNTRSVVKPSSTAQTPLDLSTVKRTSDHTARTRPRIFGLKEAPTYYPTSKEFADPIKYVQSIRAEAEEYGIVKIVPPKGWSPDFSLDTEVFRFRTRIQKLNSMEGETRANLNYLEQLYKFHRQAGHPVHKIPQLDKRPIDLFRLKKEVAQRGGYQMVTAQKKWAEIGRLLGYTRKQCTSMSNALKSAYNRVILPYEIWLSKQTKLKNTDDINKAISSINKDGGMKRVKKESDINEDDDDENERDSSSPGRGEICEICNIGENEDEILLCDGCDRGYHMYCLDPPLNSIPRTEWYCVKCLTAAGEDYGFEDGGEYSLHSFQQKCDKFKEEWFAAKDVKDAKNVTEEDCEDEFWRLVENPHESCEVEYGADLHSTQHGSGFPTMERHPQNPYSKSPWNLNVIPVLPDSLFTHIKSDISGMMVPWIYVGMCFSAFCWHNEDHYTYSINYHHWGETKTWYGIPGADALKFEDAMRRAVPELFEQQPDLLFQLVTMLSPGTLMKEGVRCYVVDQRPGQFVVTFPQAYHSGFNHGFNFCEAVNFAPYEWVDFGQECAKRYKQYKRHPCFSHDELLVTTALNDAKAEDAAWLKEALVEMCNRELNDRATVRKQHPSLKEVVDSKDRPEGKTECAYCNTFSYLSQIRCTCTEKVACTDHLEQLCSCDSKQKTLRMRFSDEELEQLVYKCTDNSQVAIAWIEKLRKTMSKSQAPSIKTLRPLLQEAAKLSLVIEEVLTLKEYVEQIEKWTEEANSFLVRKSKWRKLEHDDKQSPLEYARGQTYDTIKRLLQQSRELAFSAPEIALLQQYLDLLEDFAAKAHNVLENPKVTLSECQNVLKLGSTININTIEYTHLQILADQLEWKRTVGDNVDRFQDYSQVTSLIAQAQDCDIPANNELLMVLEERASEASVWVKQTSSILEQPLIKPEDLHHILDSANNIRVISVELRNKAQNLLNQYNEATRLAQNLLKARQELRTDWKPPVSELNKILKLINYLPMSIIGADLFHEENYHMDRWRSTLKQVLSVSEHSQGARSMEIILTHLENNAIQVTAHRNASISAPHPTDIPTTQDVFCICRSSESGLMIECDTCGEWYHGNCVRVSRREAKAQTSYICPICSISGPFSRRPSLEDFEDLLQEADQRWFAPTEYTILQSLVARVARFREEVRNFCRSKPQLGVEDVPEIRNYLRKLMGIDVYLQDETEFLSEKMRVLVPPPPPTAVKRLSNAGRKSSIDRPRGGKKPMGTQHLRHRKSSDTSTSFKNDSDDDFDNDPSYEPVARPQQPLHQHPSHHQHPYHDPRHKVREDVDDPRLYCLCRRRISDTKNNSMIQCDVCEDWFHLDCVNLSSAVVDHIDKYMCPACSHSKHVTYQYGQVRMLDSYLETKGLRPMDFNQLPEPTKPALGRPPNIIRLKLRPPLSPEMAEKKRKFSQDQIKDKKKRKHSGDKTSISPTSERPSALTESSSILFA